MQHYIMHLSLDEQIITNDLLLILLYNKIHRHKILF